MKKIFSCLLSIFILVTFTSCKKQEAFYDETNRINSPLILDYVHYNDESFYERIKEANLLIEKGDTASFVLYDELFEEYKNVLDYHFISMINYDMNYTNDYWANEFNYCDQILNGLRNAFLSMAHELSESDLKKEFEAHVNNELLLDYYKQYIPLSDEVLKLQNKESDLVAEYMGLDYDNNYYKLSGELFVKLLDVRSQIANALGYDNYIEYTDTNLYDRDYVSSDLIAFYQAAKDMNFEEVIKVKDTIKNAAPDYDVDGQQSLIDLKRTIEDVSSYCDEAYEALCANNLYWYENSELNNAVGYTIAFMSTYTPYIFNNLVGTAADLHYQVHELGHFINYFFVPSDALVFYDGNYDLLEIQSQALEFLCQDNINDILNTQESPYRFNEFYRCLETIVDGCIIDEWSRIVYSNPDMTIDEIDALYNELAYEYGLCKKGEDVSNQWKDITHNFTDPGYYISYATSMFASAQLYFSYEVDKDLAIEQYNKIVLSDSKLIGYKDAITNTNMILFTDYENTYGILQSICNRILEGVR